MHMRGFPTFSTFLKNCTRLITNYNLIFSESVVWPHGATLLLMKNYREKMHVLRDKKKSELWEIISDSIRSAGYDYSGDECNAKWRTLLQRYVLVATGICRRVMVYETEGAEVIDFDIQNERHLGLGMR